MLHSRHALTLFFFLSLVTVVFALPPSFGGFSLNENNNQLTATPTGVSTILGVPVNFYCCVDGNTACVPRANNSVCSTNGPFRSPYSTASCVLNQNPQTPFTLRCVIENNRTGELSAVRSLTYNGGTASVGGSGPCERTEFSNVYCNADGSKRAEISTGPINYLDEETNQYQPVKRRVQALTNARKTKFLQRVESFVKKRADYAFEGTEGRGRLFVKSKPSDNEAIRVEYGSKSFSFSVTGLYWTRGESAQLISDTSLETPTTQTANSTFLYNDAFGDGIDLSFDYLGERIVQDVIINNKTDLPSLPIGFGSDAQLTIRQRLYLPADLSIVVNDVPYTGGTVSTAEPILIVDAAGVRQFTIPSGTATDAAGNVAGLNYVLKTTGGQTILETNIPSNWLLDNTRNYPVRVDPSIIVGDTNWLNLIDGYIGCNQFQVTANCGGIFYDSNFYVGSVAGGLGNYALHIGYLSFYTASIPDNATITDLNLVVVPFNFYSVTGTDYNIRVRGAWDRLARVDYDTFRNVQQGTEYGGRMFSQMQSFPNVDNNFVLNSSAKTNLQGGLSYEDLFQVGLVMDSNGNQAKQIGFRSREYGSQYPRLSVIYTQPSGIPSAVTDLNIISTDGNYPLNSGFSNVKVGFTGTGAPSYNIWSGYSGVLYWPNFENWGNLIAGSSGSGYITFDLNNVEEAPPSDNTPRTYFVQGVNTSGVSLPSNFVWVKGSDRTKPNNATWISATSSSGATNKVALSWSNPTDMGSVENPLTAPYHYFPLGGDYSDYGLANASLSRGLTFSKFPVTNNSGIFGAASDFNGYGGDGTPTFDTNNCMVLDFNAIRGSDYYPVITFETWMKTPGFWRYTDVNAQEIITMANNSATHPHSNSGGGLGLFPSSGRVYMYVAGNLTLFGEGGGLVVSNEGTRLDDNEWHHIVGTWDGSTLRMYVDGVAQSQTDSYSAASKGPLDPWQFIGIGGRTCKGFYGPWSFYGTLDEVAIYKSALSQAEITARYNNGASSLRTKIERHAAFDYNSTPVNGFYDDFRSGSLAAYTQNGTWTISSGQLAYSSGACNSTNIYTTKSFSGDYWLEVDYRPTSSSSDEGIIFNVTDNSNHYLLALREANNANADLQFYRKVANSYTALSTLVPNGTNLFSTDQNYKIKILVNNSTNTFRFYVNDVFKGQVTDSTFTSGRAGFRFCAATAGKGAYDNFKIAPLLSGATVDDVNAYDSNAPNAPNFNAATVNSASQITLGWVTPTSMTDNGTINYYTNSPTDYLGNWSNFIANSHFEAGVGTTAYYFSNDTDCASSSCNYRISGNNAITGHSFFLQGYNNSNTDQVLAYGASLTNGMSYRVQFDYRCITATTGSGWNIHLYQTSPSIIANSATGYTVLMDGSTVSSKSSAAFTCAAGEKGRYSVIIPFTGTTGGKQFRITDNNNNSSNMQMVIDNLEFLPVQSVTHTSGVKDVNVLRVDNSATFGPFTGTSTAITGLTRNTRYCFQARNRDQQGNVSNYGTQLCRFSGVNTPGAPTITSVAANEINVKINQNSNPDVNTHYLLFNSNGECLCNSYGNINGYYDEEFAEYQDCYQSYDGCVDLTYTGWGAAAGRSVYGLIPDEEYYFYNRAYNGDYTHSLDSGWGGVFMQTGSPSSVRADYNTFYASNSGLGAIQISWGDINGESQYNVYRSVNAGSAWTLIANKSANTITHLDFDINDNNTYWYRVASLIDGVEYFGVTDVNVTVDRSAPSAPVLSLSSTTGANSHVDLNWNQSDDNASYASFLDANTVLYFRFEDLTNAPTTAYDSSGTQSGGLKSNTTINKGIMGTGLFFNGSSSNVTFGQNQLPTGTNPRTISGWANLAAAPSSYRWIAGYGSPSTSQAFSIGFTTNLVVCAGYGNDVTYSVNLTPYVGKWVHVACTYDGSTVRLYFNGNQVNFGSKTLNTTLSKAYVGRQVNDVEYFSGSLDEIFISKKVFSAEDVNKMYNMGIVHYAIDRYSATDPEYTPINGVFSDFDDGTLGSTLTFSNLGSGTNTYSIDNGRAKLTKTGGVAWTTGRLVTSPLFTPKFIVSYDFNASTNSGGEIGDVQYLGPGTTDFDLFASGSQWNVFTHYGGVWASRSTGGSFAVNQQYFIKILHYGTFIRVLINDGNNWDVTVPIDQSTSGGQILFQGANSATSGDVFYDNIKVSQLNDYNSISDFNAHDQNAPPIPTISSVGNATTSTLAVNWNNVTDIGTDYNYTISAIDSYGNDSSVILSDFERWPTGISGAVPFGFDTASTWAYDPSEVSRSSVAYSGRYALEWRSENANDSIRAQLGALTPGAAYLFKAKYRKIPGVSNANNTQIILIKNNSSSGWLNGTWGYGPTGTDYWQEYSTVITIPADATSVQLVIRTNGNQTVGTSGLLLDDITLQKVESKTVTSGLRRYWLNDINQSNRIYGPYGSNSATVTGLNPGSQHCFQVKAQDWNDNNSSLSSNYFCNTTISDTFTLSSATHPNEETWYNNNSVSMVANGTFDHIYYLINGSDTVENENIIYEEGTYDLDGVFNFNLNDYGDGVWYVHAMGSNAEESYFTSVTTYAIYYDSTSPIDELIAINNWSGNVTGYTNDTTPPLGLSVYDDLSGPEYMYLSCNGSTWSNAITYAASYANFNINTGAGCTNGDGNKTIYAKFSDYAGNESSTTATGTFVLDTVAPTSNSVSIDSNAWTGGVSGYTNDRTPRINLSSTGAYQMSYSCNALSYSNYETYNTTRNVNQAHDWNLAPTPTTNGCTNMDGTINLYVQFKDQAGNVASAVNTSVVLDRVAPGLTFSSPENGYRYSDPDPILYLEYVEETSGIASCTIRVAPNDVFVPYDEVEAGLIEGGYCAFDDYPARSEGTHYWFGWITDLAGNSNTVDNGAMWSFTRDITAPSIPNTFTIENDSSPPYWDNVNNSKTNLLFSLGETGGSCKWNNTNVVYASMSNNCLNIGSLDKNCTLGNLSQTTTSSQYNTRYHSCIDDVSNAYTTQGINFGIDYTAPTTSDDSSSTIVAPPYVVTLTESDNASNAGSDITSYYCNTSNSCTPSTSINTGGTVTFTNSNRGTNYLRYYSTDLAGNTQSTVTKTININRLPIWGSPEFDANVSGTISCLGGEPIRFDSNVSDPDAGQTLTLYVCSSNSATSAGCSETTLCSSTGSSTNPSCVYLQPDSNESITAYAYVYDSLNEFIGSPRTDSYTCDAAVPTITLTTPANNSSSSDNTPSFVGTPSETLSACYLQVATDENFTSIVSGYNEISIDVDCTYTAPASFNNGTYYYRMKGTDSVGNQGPYSTTYTFSIDTTGVSTSITSIAGDSSAPYWDTTNDTQTIVILAGNKIDLSCRFDESDVNYTTMNSSNNCSINGTTITCNLGSLTQRAVSTTHYISCKDLTNTEQSSAQNVDLSFGVDWTAPTIGLTSVTSNATASHATSPVNIESSIVTDNISINSSSCEYTLNGTDWVAGTWSAPSTKCVDSSIELNDGNNTINYRVRDSAGNLSTGSLTYRVKDNNAPTGTTLSFGSINTTYIIASVSNASDAGAGLHSTPYDFLESVTSSSSGFQSSTDWNKSGLDVNSQYTFSVRSKDALNNTSSFTSTQSRYTYANTPTAPTINAITDTTLSLTINTNNNPTGTLFAIYDYNRSAYVSLDGNANAETAVWQTATNWNPITVTGMTKTTQHCLAVKAKNGDNVETALGPTTCITTLSAFVPISLTSSTHPDQNRWYNRLTARMVTRGTFRHVHYWLTQNETETASAIYNNGTQDADGRFDINLPISGTHYVHVTAHDLTHGVLSTAHFRINYDSNIPTAESINITSWSGGNESYTNDQTPPLSLSASDTGGSGLYRMQFSCNGSTWASPRNYATLANQGRDNNFSVSSNSYGCTTIDGNRTIYVRFGDQAGNWSNSINTDSFVLDRIAPTDANIHIDSTSWTGNVAGYTNDATPLLNIKVTGAYLMQLSCLGGFIGTDSAVSSTVSDFNIRSPSNNCTNAEGIKRVHARFKDLAGNIRTVYTAAFTLDQTALTVTPYRPNANYTYNYPDPELSAYARGTLASVQACYVRIDSDNPPASPLFSFDQYSGGSALCRFSPEDYLLTTDGNYFWDVNAYDKAGNWSNYFTPARRIIKDITAPLLPTSYRFDADSTEPYWDSVNNSSTILRFTLRETRTSCKWSDTNGVFTDFSNNCSISNLNVTCNLGNRPQTTNASPYNSLYYSCSDAVGNYYPTQHLEYGVDFNKPTTTDDINGSIQVFPFTFSLIEQDNITSEEDLTTYYCMTSATCNPTNLYDHGSSLSFDELNGVYGNNYVRYYSIDLAGNIQNTVTKTITLNQVPVWGTPAFDANISASISCVNPQAIRFNATASDPDAGQTLRFFVCSTPDANASGCLETTLCSSTGSSTNPSCVYAQEASVDGIQNAYGFIFDSLGQSTGTYQTESWSCDSQLPTVVLNTPQDNAYTADTTPTFSATPSEAVNNCSLQVSTDQNFATIITSFDNVSMGSDCTYTPSASLDLGAYYARVRATDVANNTGDYSESHYFTIVDGSGPTVSLISVAGDTTAPYWDTSNNNTTAIIVNASASATCKISSEDVDYSAMSTNCSNAGGTEHTCAINNLTQASQYYYFVACSESGISNTSQTNLDVLFGVDWTAPTIGLTSLTSNATNTGYATSPANIESGTISDNIDINVNSCEYTLNGTTWNQGTWNNLTSKCVDVSVNLNDGNNTINYRVKDLAGNTGNGSLTYAIKDNEGPSNASLITFVPSLLPAVVVNLINASDPAGLATNYKYFEETTTGSTFGYTNNSWNFTNADFNTLYTFRGKVKDALGNESNYTAPVSVYTTASRPFTHSLTTLTSSSISLILDDNSNPVGTQFALLDDANKYVISSNGSFVISPNLTEWRTITDWNNGFITLSSLPASSNVCIRAVARNGSLVQTTPSQPSCITTNQDVPITVSDINNNRWQPVNARFALSCSVSNGIVGVTTFGAGSAFDSGSGGSNYNFTPQQFTPDYNVDLNGSLQYNNTAVSGSASTTGQAYYWPAGSVSLKTGHQAGLMNVYFQTGRLEKWKGYQFRALQVFDYFGSKVLVRARTGSSITKSSNGSGGFDYTVNNPGSWTNWYPMFNRATDELSNSYAVQYQFLLTSDSNEAAFKPVIAGLDVFYTRPSTLVCDTMQYRIDQDANTAVSFGSWETYTPGSRIDVNADGNFAVEYYSTYNGITEPTKREYVLIQTALPNISADFCSTIQDGTTFNINWNQSTGGPGIFNYQIFASATPQFNVQQNLGTTYYGGDNQVSFDLSNFDLNQCGDRFCSANETCAADNLACGVGQICSNGCRLPSTVTNTAFTCSDNLCQTGENCPANSQSDLSCKTQFGNNYGCLNGCVELGGSYPSTAASTDQNYCGDGFCSTNEFCVQDNVYCRIEGSSTPRMCGRPDLGLGGCRDAPSLLPQNTCGDGICGVGENCPQPAENNNCATLYNNSNYACTNGCVLTNDSRLLAGKAQFDPFVNGDGLKYFLIRATDLSGVTREKTVTCKIDTQSPFTIPKSEGRRLQKTVGLLSVDFNIPPNGFAGSATDANIVLDVNTNPPAFPGGTLLDGNAIQVDNESGTLQFIEPIPFQVSFTRESLSCWPNNCSAEWANRYLSIYLYDENTDSDTYLNWIPIPTDVNWDGNYMTADINHFSLYGSGEDNTNPTVTITSPITGSTSGSSSVTMTYTGTDPSGTISKYWVQLDNNALVDNGTNTSYTFTNLANGSYTLSVIATDAADNNSTKESVTITVSASASSCGNGVCEEGETSGTCPADCGGSPPTNAVCGNNSRESGEQCDDGNLINGDGCSSSCTTELPTCTQLGGNVCAVGQSCSVGGFVSSRDSALCCLSECIGEKPVYTYSEFVRTEPIVNGFEEPTNSNSGYRFLMGPTVLGTVSSVTATDSRVNVRPIDSSNTFVSVNLTPGVDLPPQTYAPQAYNLTGTVSADYQLISSREELAQGLPAVRPGTEVEVVPKTRSAVYYGIDSARFGFYNHETNLQRMDYSRIVNLRLMWYNFQ